MDIILIQEISTKQLQDSTRKAFGDDRETKKIGGMSHGPITYDIVEENNNIGLLCNTKISNSKSNSENKCSIMFDNLKVLDEEGTFIVTKDDGIMIKPFSSKTDVKVRCSCMDFRFRFSDVNADKDGLYGKRFPPYIRKTDTRPPVNPSSAPGLCKHLYKFFDVLEKEEVFKP